MDAIRCIVGLGNPGAKYEDTRHNAGFRFVDALARANDVALRAENKFSAELGRITTPAGDCWLLKPMTYMNHSGRSVAAVCNFYRISPPQLLVAYDELDLDPGVVRLKTGGGHGGHNGMRDICAALGSQDFHRLRIGIGHPGHREAVVGHVLSRAGKEEQRAIDDAITAALAVVDIVLAGDLQKAMTRLHTAG
ncbi:MAG: aminoacyl-tRNA hydrolase [Chromatiaceae bacterium]|nr:aminoacyl-tRNA hydrolase [Gammaproteobacteria bacterium]MCP5301515.1 aminoacyl-tRNA hydrolase [Chromatiaceae bacterium]MCP5423079.1 aminoacyl-tRNA hydrolase [Chromatiaceae bacterium]